MNLNLPPGEFRSHPETEELATAKAFGIAPPEWELLRVRKKEELIAYLRDEYDMQRVMLVPKDRLLGLGGEFSWVRLDAASPRR